MKTRRSFLKTLAALPLVGLAAKATAAVPVSAPITDLQFDPAKEALVLLIRGARFNGHNVIWDRHVMRTANFSLHYGGEQNMRRRLQENRYRFMASVVAAVIPTPPRFDEFVHVLKHRRSSSAHTDLGVALAKANLIPSERRQVDSFAIPDYGPDAVAEVWLYRNDPMWEYNARDSQQRYAEMVAQGQLGKKHNLRS